MKCIVMVANNWLVFFLGNIESQLLQDATTSRHYWQGAAVINLFLAYLGLVAADCRLFFALNLGGIAVLGLAVNLSCQLFLASDFASVGTSVLAWNLFFQLLFGSISGFCWPSWLSTCLLRGLSGGRGADAENNVWNLLIHRISDYPPCWMGLIRGSSYW